MVAPSGEIAPGEHDNYLLQRRALESWKHLNAELGDLGARPVTLHETGTLIVGWDASDRRQIDQYLQVADEFGAPHVRQSREMAPWHFTGLSDRIGEGVVMPEDAWLDPDEAVAVVCDTLATLGVTLVHDTVLRVGGDSNGVVAETVSGRWRARRGILATGWAPLPDGVTSSGVHLVRPVRGVTARVQGLDRSDLATVRALVRGRALYMVSRPGGYCVLGASSDERAEPAVEVGELHRLLRDALDVVPDLETATVIETRVGLRPASTDARPFFEVLTPSGWAWSTGHYRHGVTLAPLAALDAVAFVERHP